MLDRKIYQLCRDKREVSIFLRDQQRWIENATITDIEGNVITLRYETEDEDEISAWEELILLESIGAVNRKLSSFPRGHSEPVVSYDCPEVERFPYYPPEEFI